MQSRTNIKLALVSAMLVSAAAASSAAADSRAVVRSDNSRIVMSSDGNCVRTKWMTDGDACAPAQPVIMATLAPQTAVAEEQRTVYFGFNQTTLTPQAKDKLNSLSAAITSRQDVTGAHVYGYADRIGSSTYNEKLSQMRAESVRNFMVTHGVVNANVAETRWYGKTRPATNCPDTLLRPALIQCLQMDRKVEVEIDYKPEGTAK